MLDTAKHQPSRACRNRVFAFVLGAFALMALPALAAEDYTEAFGAIGAAGSVARSDNYGACDQVQMVGTEDIRQSSDDYALTDALATEADQTSPAAVSQWELYE